MPRVQHRSLPPLSKLLGPCNVLLWEREAVVLHLLSDNWDVFHLVPLFSIWDPLGFVEEFKTSMGKEEWPHLIPSSTSQGGGLWLEGSQEGGIFPGCFALGSG